MFNYRDLTKTKDAIVEEVDSTESDSRLLN